MSLRYVEGEPEEGTPTLGVVFHVVRESEIRRMTDAEPIGYVVEDDDEEGLGMGTWEKEE